MSEVNTGTADQAVIEISPSASNITMRTKTGDEDMSVESESCKIPISVKASLIKKTQQSNKVLEIIDGDEQDDHDLPNGVGMCFYVFFYVFFRYFKIIYLWMNAWEKCTNLYLHSQLLLTYYHLL